MKPEEAFASGVAVVTGAGSGIGEALARKLAALGMKVVVAEVSAERGENVASSIRAAGGEAMFVQTDVTDRASVEALATATHAAWGDVSLLVNNAGISVLGNMWEIEGADWDRAIATNIGGVVHGLRVFVPGMIAAGTKARIANVASIASLATSTANSPYMISKHAVLGLSENLWLELKDAAPHISVSTVLPGVVATRIMRDTTLASDTYAAQLEGMTKILESGQSAARAADIILAGIAMEEFWITTHPGVLRRMADHRAETIGGLLDPRPVDPDIFGATD